MPRSQVSDAHAYTERKPLCPEDQPILPEGVEPPSTYMSFFLVDLILWQEVHTRPTSSCHPIPADSYSPTSGGTNFLILNGLSSSASFDNIHQKLPYPSCVPDPDYGHTPPGFLCKLPTRLFPPQQGCAPGRTSSGLKVPFIPQRELCASRFYHLWLISWPHIHSLDLLSFTFTPSYENRLLGRVSDTQNQTLHFQIVAIFKLVTCTYFGNILIAPKCYCSFPFKIAFENCSTYFEYPSPGPALSTVHGFNVLKKSLISFGVKLVNEANSE